MPEGSARLVLSVPSKSFFLGEYLALAGGRTLLAATLPRFALRLLDGSGAVRGIAPAAPAGRLIAEHRQVFGGFDIEFEDPHAGAGGWGASGAQFLMCYAALQRVRSGGSEPGRIDAARLLDAFVEHAWDGRGPAPSGADLVAQLEGGLVEFCKAEGTVRRHDWPFRDLEFYLVATGNKLATHEHLRRLADIDTGAFSAAADRACDALARGDSARFVDGVRAYAAELRRQRLVDPHTLALTERLDAIPGVVASKGCGAFGADVALAIVRSRDAPSVASMLEREVGTPVGHAQLAPGLAIAGR